MKKLRIIFPLIVSIFLMSFFSSKKYSSPEKYAKKLIKVLKKEDVKKITEFYITCEELKLGIAKNINDSLKKAKFVERFTSEKCEEELSKNRSRFEDVLNKGKEMGIVWKLIKYKNIVYEIKTGDFGIKSIPEAKIIFLSNGQLYYIKIKGLGNIDGSWNAGKIYGPYLKE